MPLSQKDDIRDDLCDDLYCSSDLAEPVPKYKFPLKAQAPHHAYALVHDELMLDGVSRLNLATFCQTWAEPQVRQLMDECMDKNIVDKDEYPQTAEIEARCVHMLADLWNAPDAANTIGCSTTGSSEAALLGGLALKWRWREKRKAAGKLADKPNLVTGPVQVCWHKLARYFDIELREAPAEPNEFLLSPKKVLDRVDENTIGVVPTLGVTFTLEYEPVKQISDALDALQTRGGPDVPIHVDGASGGFLAPFLTPDLEWDFRLPRVKSINTSGHKYGLAPLGCGWVIWREARDLPDDLIFRVNYLGGEMPTFALNFSRPGGQVVCQYYNFLRLGRTGYAKIQGACARAGKCIADAVREMGPFEVIYDGRDGIPGATWKLKDGTDPGFNLYDVADRLRARGWLVPAYSLPANCQNIVVQRVLCRHGFSMDMAGLMLEDLQRALDHLRSHPVTHPLTEAEAAGFNHL